MWTSFRSARFQDGITLGQFAAQCSRQPRIAGRAGSPPLYRQEPRRSRTMPLLMCPNCNASMTEVKRNDVAFDMCPTCRGVWLDRGELEKIVAGAKDEMTAFEQDRRQFYDN